MATTSAPVKLTQMNAPTKRAQIRVARRSPAYWGVTIDNPPINVMGPEMVRQFQEVIDALEADEQVRVVVFDSAVDDYEYITQVTAMGPLGLEYLSAKDDPRNHNS
jgi:hypothetical protein